MKHIRVTAQPDLDRSPSFVAYLLDSPEVAEARALDWNRADVTTSTHLYAIKGDARGFQDAATKTRGVESVTLSATEEPISYSLIDVRDDVVPMFGVIEDALARTGMVVHRPLVYRKGQIHGHVVGDPSALQAVLDRAPETLDIGIDAIGQFPSAQVNPASRLSERQSEAIAVALELGYYDQPRQATHEDVAERLGCAPNTASAHLQKGEAKLVRAGMNTFHSSI
ncbi:helix-turn-helix domain-containing protein [Halobellus ruber]|uniref:Helix-turn-helix domain-containing protein n=1 Tax=Halobellus ruber TaxID=2761102 RepID=A0A7J9SDA2_9EURY|nr:helix-turn-helix domain-containing protein [Halobellus ruber]MBB6644895.1 helix-turn-helix domain-containing protein [Halobellus ruber]